MTQRFAKDVLVDTAWVQKHHGDAKVRIVEVDEDETLYERGHIPGAIAWSWERDLNDPVRRDFVDAAALEALLARSGIGPDTTVVLYGDKSNWFATYTYWLLQLRGFRNVKILDGGRTLWAKLGLPMVQQSWTPDPAPPVRLESKADIRAFRGDVERAVGAERNALVDVRSPQEYTGELIAMPAYPQEGARRGGHIPGAVSVPWGQNVREDGTFKNAAELRALYAGHGVTSDKDVIAYCRIGERASLTWFVLQELLGFPRVRNYDGSWTEWGSLVAVPVAKGAKP